MSRKEGEEKGETGQGRKCILATHFSKCMPQTRAAAPLCQGCLQPNQATSGSPGQHVLVLLSHLAAHQGGQGGGGAELEHK